MESSQALSIIQSLADGVDPRTGECFAAESAYQSAPVVRALSVAVRAILRLIETEHRRKSLPGNVGKAWSVHEEGILISEFDSGKNVSELASQLQRTAGAVRARLVRLGKIEDPGYSFPRRNMRQ